MFIEIPGRTLAHCVSDVTVRSKIERHHAPKRTVYIFAPVLFSLLLSAGVNLQLFQDGSSYLFEILASHSAVRHQRLGVFLIQAPAILAGKALSRLQIDPTLNLQILRFLFSLSYSLVPALSLTFCWLILRKKHEDLFVWAVLSVLFINLVNFSWVSELLISLQFSFALLLATILLPGTRLHWFLTAALLPTVLFLHPLVIVPFLAIAFGCTYVATRTSGQTKALIVSAIIFVIAAVVRGILNLNMLNAYETSFLEPVEMGSYLVAASLEKQVFLATSLAIGTGCVFAKSGLLENRRLAILIGFLISAQVFTLVLALSNLSLPPRFAFLIGIMCFGLTLGFYGKLRSQAAVDGKINVLYAVFISSALLSSVLLISEYFAPGGKFQLKTGLTVFASLFMMLMASVDSVRDITLLERARRFNLVAVLCFAFAVVMSIKSVVWYSAVNRLEKAVMALQVTCAEIDSPEFTWLGGTPYSIINNWSLPTLALVVQDMPPRKLLLAENGCTAFYDSGLVQIDPWTDIPITRLTPPLN